jgi:Ca2+-binding RTX toxin-like protein
MAIVTTIIATVIGTMLIVAGLSLPFVNSVSATLHSSSSSDSNYNVIEAACSIGSIITTDGTNDPDLMLGCDLEDVMYGEADNDVLQGRFDDDALYGDSGDDNLEGGAGGDELYAGTGDDVIFAGFEDDFLVGGEGNDELYGEDGNDLLEGGDGADYFDCGDGLDIIVDFDPSKGDIHANNCEDVREHL